MTSFTECPETCFTLPRAKRVGVGGLAHLCHWSSCWQHKYRGCPTLRALRLLRNSNLNCKNHNILRSANQRTATYDNLFEFRNSLAFRRVGRRKPHSRPWGTTATKPDNDSIVRPCDIWHGRTTGSTDVLRSFNRSRHPAQNSIDFTSPFAP